MHAFSVMSVVMMAIALASPTQDANSEILSHAIPVVVERSGDVVRVGANFTAPVSPKIAWEVLTDYERMPEFLPHLRTSKVLARTGNRLRAEQTGAVLVGPIPIPFEYLRDVDLTPPRRLHSVVVGGSLKSGTVTTELAAEGASTRISYWSEAVPAIWVPLGVSEAFIRDHVRKQLGAMRAEMVRRSDIEGRNLMLQ